MYNVIIWGSGYIYNQFINNIKYQELLGEINIIGITGRDKIYLCLDGYSFIPENELDIQAIDFVIIAAGEEYYNEIFNSAKSIGFNEDSIIQARVFAYPGFRFNEYAELIKSRISIIANNCWGGVAHHTLGLPFRSPFINMAVPEKDYLLLLENLQYYLTYELEFKEFGYSAALQREYPIGALNDVELRFIHYMSMDEAKVCWYRRLERMNWNNFFIMMYTENKETAEAFERLEYSKKICFVPFQTELKSALRLQMSDCEGMRNIPFWEIVNNTAGGCLNDYNLIKLLNTGEVNHDRLCSE